MGGIIMWTLRVAGLAALTLASIGGGISARAESPLLTNAWKCGEDHECAIKAALTCVDKFGLQAADDQKAIESGPESKRPLDPGAADKDSPGAKRTFANGVLNDAAACMFILGNAQRARAMCPEARSTYEKLSKLTYARVWDNQGWFWAPASDAQKALANWKCPSS